MAFLPFKKSLVVFTQKEKFFMLAQLQERHGFSYSLLESKEGKLFKQTTALLVRTKKHQKYALGGGVGFRINILGSKQYASWIKEGVGLVVAEVKKPSTWEVLGEWEEIKQPAAIIQDPKRSLFTKYLAFYTSASGTLSVARITFGKQGFQGIGPVARLPKGGDYGPAEVLGAEVTEEGILILYSVLNGWGFPIVRALLVDKHQPDEVLWRSENALWEAPLSVPPIPPHLVGIVHSQEKIFLYVEYTDGRVEVAILPKIQARLFPKLTQGATNKKHQKTLSSPGLVRFAGNPLIEPREENQWEAFAAFNPAALHIDGRVHLLYRAQGHSGISVLGYASSENGIDIHERGKQPAYVPRADFDTRETDVDLHPYAYVSGGGLGGCEDPRLILIENTIYLIYVAFDGSRPPGVALSSISKEDFLAKRWTWKPPKLISQPGVIQKNWVLFPEKINGKFAILHGINPDIQIEYLESLDELGETYYIESLASHGGRGYVAPERRKHWDNIVRGVGAPPLWTESGWLVFYHAMDQRDPGKYKVGALLLDLEHPETILHRATEPVLEPEVAYENEGHKRGVVYVCGAIIKDGILFVYYGASDKSAAVAAAPLQGFLAELMADRAPSLQRASAEKVASK